MKYRLCAINKDVKNLFAVAGFSELKKKEGKSFCLVGEDGVVFSVSGQIPVYHISANIAKSVMKLEASAYFIGMCERTKDVYSDVEFDVKKTGEIKSGVITCIPAHCTNLGLAEQFIKSAGNTEEPYLSYLKDTEKNIVKALNKDKKKDVAKEMKKLVPIVSNPRYTTLQMVEKQNTLYSKYDIVLVPAGEEREKEEDRVHVPVDTEVCEECNVVNNNLYEDEFSLPFGLGTAIYDNNQENDEEMER